jgi:hypothetical protein
MLLKMDIVSALLSMTTAARIARVENENQIPKANNGRREDSKNFHES